MPGTDLQPISPKLWSSGFLSSEYAGVAFRTKGAPVLYLEDPSGMSRNVRRELIDAVNSINQTTFEEIGDPETEVALATILLAGAGLLMRSFLELENVPASEVPGLTGLATAVPGNRKKQQREAPAPARNFIPYLKEKLIWS